ncbi:hypothetical protein KI387_009529, partial [Taxus chinensis]
MAVAMAATLPAASLFVNTDCIKQPSLRRRGSHSTLIVTAHDNGRRAAMLRLGLGLGLGSGALLSGNANAGLVEDLLAKSAANKELNDAKRLATSGANIARAYTVQFGTCQFPYNFTGCQDLARTK